MLRKHGHEVVAVLVGKDDSRQIPRFYLEKIEAPVFDFRSPNFTALYKQKRPNLVLSVIGNFLQSFIFRRSILFVKSKILEYRPDVVVNFYEMITGLAFRTYRFDKKLNVKLISIAHQYMLLNPNLRTTSEQDIGTIFRMITRVTCQCLPRSWHSAREMPGCEEKNLVVVPPLLRPEVLAMNPPKGIISTAIHQYRLL